MPRVYLNQLFLSYGANVRHTQGGCVLADEMILGSTSPAPSSITYSCVEKFSRAAGSLSASACQSVPLSEGPWPLPNLGPALAMFICSLIE